MNYNTLTVIQKRCVDAFITQNPKLATVDTITRKEIDSAFNALYADRANSGVKVGYPGWIVKSKELQLSRGLYRFPRPGANMDATSVTTKGIPKAQKLDTSDEDREFFKDLADFGVEVV